MIKAVHFLRFAYSLELEEKKIRENVVEQFLNKIEVLIRFVMNGGTFEIFLI